MATAVHIPVSVHLKTNYRPDRDYVDGEVEEYGYRSLPRVTASRISA
jgi:hypothetical protein